MRDIEKDKVYLATFKNGASHVGIMTVPMVDMAEHWIAQYEAAQARISELEYLLHKSNRSIIERPTTHAEMLKHAFDALSKREVVE